jgi:hypothetical protein
VTTISTAAMGVGAVILLRLAARTESPLASPVGILLAALLAATLLATFALAPSGYAIAAGHLRIERPLRAIDVPLASIRAAAALPDGLAGSVRVAGSAGLFGYYGRFWSRRLGAFRLYATRRTGLVVVDTAAERFVLSPEPQERFLEAVLARAPSAAHTVAGTPLAARPFSRSTKLLLAALVVLVPVAIAVAMTAIWAYAPVAARVEEGRILIERRLAPAVVIPVADVRGVEPVPLAHGARLRRVAGTAVPGGVRYGHFRSTELGDVQLYAWRWDAYVLLDLGDARVVLTPDDPAAFVAAVRGTRQP